MASLRESLRQRTVASRPRSNGAGAGAYRRVIKERALVDLVADAPVAK
jgi:hypothetical protein